MIDAIAFDWGGVFTEGTFDGSAMAALAAATGAAPERVANVYLPLMADFEAGAFDLPAFRRRFAEGLGVAIDAAAFDAAFLGAVRERRAMFAVLGSIPDGLRVGMLSNNVPVLCDRVREDPRMARIERFVFSNEIGVRKPDPAAFEALADALGVPPERTVFVDDAERNVAAARELGFRTIHLVDLPTFLEDWRTLLPHLPTGLELAE